MTKLADGSHHGIDPYENALRIYATPEPPTAGDDLAVAQAERDAALNALAKLERVLTKIGGYMPHEDQVALWDARAILAAAGRALNRESL